ncbi:MAG: hypothetical protein WEB57_08820 [Pseudohongiellaceae bacterium]
MKAVILDAATLGDDVDLTPIGNVTESLTVYETSRSTQCRERLAGAQAAITNKAVLDATFNMRVAATRCWRRWTSNST